MSASALSDGSSVDAAPVEDGEVRALGMGDRLATGLVCMLGLTVLQRFVGFGRNLLFCRFLSDEALGRWSLIFSFMLMAAPLAVAGLPGTFGRYIEYYRQRGQLATYLRRVAAAAALSTTAVLSLFWLRPDVVGWVVFRDPQQTRLIALCSLVLVVVIVDNFLQELFTALRMVRAISVLKFVSSLSFAGFAVALLWTTEGQELAVLVSYGAGSLVVVLAGFYLLRSVWSSVGSDTHPLAHRSMWLRLLPFAGWIWLTNMLSNLYDAADRFMILHFGQLRDAASSVIGQYHSSRVVPLLLVSIAGMLATVLMPYLSRDWETGDRQAVSQRLGQTLKLTALSLTAGGWLILVSAPLLFNVLLAGKYALGQSVLPWTLVYCSWFSLVILAQNYLWCAEKAGHSSLAMMIGLLVNIVANLLLLPRWGLMGAVWATGLANLVALALIYWFSHRQGMRIDGTLLAVSLLPLILVCNPVVSGAALVVVIGLGYRWVMQAVVGAVRPGVGTS